MVLVMFEDLLARIAVELKKPDLPYMIIGGRRIFFGTGQRVH